jgi:sn-glycerol 3-phosphate transport system substrate-binding protein
MGHWSEERSGQRGYRRGVGMVMWIWRRCASFLLAAMVFAVLIPWPAGAQAGVTLRYYYPVGVSGPLNKLMTEMVRDFNASHPGITIDPIFAGNYVDAMAKAMTGVMGGTPPDVAVLDTPELFSLLDRDAIIPLDDLIAASGGQTWLNDFYPALLSNARANGHVYSIPWQRSTPIFYYNKDLFRKAGLNPNRPPKTWTELVQYAQKLTIRDRDRVVQWGVQIPVVDTSPWIFQGFIMEAGGTFFTPDGKSVNFNSPEAVRALQFILDLQHKYKVHPTGPSGEAFWDQTAQDFIQQKVAMMYLSTGAMTFVRKNATFQWAAAFMPADKQYGAPTGGGSFYVFKRIPASHVSAAWTFIRWMTEPATAVRWTVGTGYVPIRKSIVALPAFNEYLKISPSALVASQQLKVAGEQMTIHEVDRIGLILVAAVQAAQTGRLSAQAALDDAQKRSMAILSAYK